MKKSSLKTLLCLVLCLAMTVSLFGCTRGGTASIGTPSDLEYGEPDKCTLCPDKEQCCFCYQYGDCVCGQEGGSTGNASGTASGTTSGSGSNRPGNSGGSGGTTTTVKYDPVKSLKGKTITIMRSWGPYVSGNNTAHDNWNKRVAELEKKYKFDIVEKQWSVTLDQEAMAGVKPSGQLYQVNGDWAAAYAKAGYIAPWDDAMKATGIDMTSDVYFRNSVQLSNYNGKQWAIGVEEGKMMSQVCYNKNLTSQFADIEKLMDEGKWTWSAMTDIAKKIKAKYPDKWGMSCDYLLGVYGMVASNGGQLTSVAKDGTLGSNLTDTKVKQALQQYYDWLHVDKVAVAPAAGAAWDWGLKELMKGNIAFTFDGEAAYDLLKEGMGGNEYGIAYLPKGPSAKEYYVCMESAFPYVMPKAYESEANDLLFVVDALYQLHPGYTKDTQLRDLYVRKFSNSTTYNRVKNMHRTIKCAPIIEIELGSTQEWSASIRQLLEGKTTVGAYIDTYNTAFNVYMKDHWKGFKFTGKLG